MAGTRMDDTAGLAKSFNDVGLTDRRTLELVTRALERGETIDRGLLKLMAEQADLVRVWAKEFLPQPSDREVQR